MTNFYDILYNYVYGIYYFVVLSNQIICVSYKMNEKKNNIYTIKKIIRIIIINHQKLIATAFPLTYQSHSTEKSIKVD
jgi:hypothetical protein